MPRRDLLFCLFGGAFLANAVLHFVGGTMGRPFESPFAKLPAERLSSSKVDVLFAFLNIVVGYVLACRIGDIGSRSTADVLAGGPGARPIALLDARHFGRFQGGDQPEHP